MAVSVVERLVREAILEELRAITRRKRRITVGDDEYELRGRVYESFGEDAFRVGSWVLETLRSALQ